jgi:hypothetical protein
MTKIIEILKNILPVTIFLIGKIIELIGNSIVGVSQILYNISATLHTQLGTKTGVKLKEMEKSVADVLKIYNQVANKVTKSKNESDRLANLAKSNVNVVHLGNKKNENTED